MSDDRLPFPIHGTRMSGEGDLSSELGDAKRLLYLANLIADTAEVPVFGLRAGTSYGEVSADVVGPLAFKRVRIDDPEEPPPDPQPKPVVTGRLVWLPEGLVLTPRGEGAPDGYGMPPTKNGLGTPGGPLKQVILNRFRNNQYPDALYRLAGLPEADASSVFAGNLFFMDWELDDDNFGMGVKINYGAGASKLIPQFTKRWVPKFREADGGKWFCHRPQYCLTETPFAEVSRKETNLIRERVKGRPLGKPLRGFEGELSQDIIYQHQYSGVGLAHDSNRFRSGHQRFLMRALSRAANVDRAGENLHFNPGAIPGKAFGYSATYAWEKSPRHYANMVDNWNNDVYYGWIDSAAGPTDLFETPGARGTQIFCSARSWVAAGAGTHEKKAPVTIVEKLWGETNTFLPIYPQAREDNEPGFFTRYVPEIAYRGRTIPLNGFAGLGGVLEHENEFRILSGTAVLGEGGEVTHIRVATLWRPDPYRAPAVVRIHEGRAHDYAATRKEIARYTLPFENGSFISRVQWSASGKKAVFCYTEVVDAPRRALDDRWEAGDMWPGSRSVFGQTIHFVEFRDGGFHYLFEDSLTITPTKFGIKDIAPGVWQGYHAQECNDECELLAAYSGEDLVFATIKFTGSTSHMTHSEDGAEGVYEKSIRGSLVFPDGTELVYVDIHSETFTEPGTGAPQVALFGYVRHLLSGFDIMDPEGVAYVQYDLPTREHKWLTMKLVICGEVVKSHPDPTYRGAEGLYARHRNAATGGTGIRPGVVPTLAAHKGFTLYHSGHTANFFTSMSDWLHPIVPAVPYKAVLVGYSHTMAPHFLPRGPMDDEILRHHEYVTLGPTIVTDRITEQFGGRAYGRVESFRQCKYGGERLYAGRIESTLVGGIPEWDLAQAKEVKFSAFPEEEDQFYWCCTFDLAAALKVPNLKDNILPIGVL